MGRVLRRLSRPSMKARGFLVGPSRCDAKWFWFVTSCVGANAAIRQEVSYSAPPAQSPILGGSRPAQSRKGATYHAMRPKGKGSGGGGRVKGGTEDASRVCERTRRILDAPASALQSPMVSSRRRRLRPDQMAGLGEMVVTLHRCRSSVGVLGLQAHNPAGVGSQFKSCPRNTPSLISEHLSRWLPAD